MSSSPSAAHLLALLRRNAASPAVALRLFLHLSSAASPPPPRSTSFLARLLAAYPAADALLPRLLCHLLSFPDPSRISSRCCRHPKPGLPLRLALPVFRSLRALTSTPPPPPPVYNRLILAALRESRLDLVEALYKDLLLAGAEPGVFTRNLLLQALCEAGRMELAQRVFDAMPDRNEFSFGILARGYCHAGRSVDALEVLDTMPAMNLVVCNTVVAGFCREGQVEEAEKLVERMRSEGLAPNVVTFNARISALCKAGRVLDAYRIFKDMQEEWEQGVPRPNQVTFDIMLSGFCDAGLIDEARVLVDIMRCGGFLRRVESYNRWLSGLVKNGRVGEAQELLREMAHEGIQPNSYTYNIIVAGLCKEGKAFDVRRVEEFVKSGVMTPDVVTYTSLLHAYCSKGNIVAANRILDEMAQRGNSKLDVAMGIVDGMWKEGSAALGRLGNSFLSVREVLYCLMCTELSTYGRWIEASNILETALEMKISIQNFPYKQIIAGLCEVGEVDHAHSLLKLVTAKGHTFDAAAFMPVIDALSDRGKKQDADMLSEKMMEMADCTDDLATGSDKNTPGSRKHERDKYGESDWHALLHRDDSARTIMKITKRVQTGWGQRGNVYEHKQQQNDDFYILENTG
ncbi:hypothetical protein PR202_gb06130 [Eleusine coracana subsp. coracana]|uniref:Pentatricopeptide repeat-containing protein n=1 Tax=Eleusine coracana subsp. coracana TaxID=191504 RepID=A0AAV5E832_ELECO|nr:hypothetical protein PR202_gb06130 [Eleusine coracana subsp. coracana]